MKRILFLLPLIASIALAVDKVQIVNDSEADKVTVANQKIEISSASYLHLIASNTLSVGSITNSTYAFTLNNGTAAIIGGDIWMRTIGSSVIQRSTDTGSCHRLVISSQNLVTAKSVDCP